MLSAQLDTLPDEVLLIVLEHCNVYALGVLERVCKRFLSFIRNEASIWRGSLRLLLGFQAEGIDAGDARRFCVACLHPPSMVRLEEQSPRRLGVVIKHDGRAFLYEGKTSTVWALSNVGDYRSRILPGMPLSIAAGRVRMFGTRRRLVVWSDSSMVFCIVEFNGNPAVGAVIEQRSFLDARALFEDYVVAIDWRRRSCLVLNGIDGSEVCSVDCDSCTDIVGASSDGGRLFLLNRAFPDLPRVFRVDRDGDLVTGLTGPVDLLSTMKGNAANREFLRRFIRPDSTRLFVVGASLYAVETKAERIVVVRIDGADRFECHSVRFSRPLRVAAWTCDAFHSWFYVAVHEEGSPHHITLALFTASRWDLVWECDIRLAPFVVERLLDFVVYDPCSLYLVLKFAGSNHRNVIRVSTDLADVVFPGRRTNKRRREDDKCGDDDRDRPSR